MLQIIIAVTTTFFLGHSTRGVNPFARSICVENTRSIKTIQSFNNKHMKPIKGGDNDGGADKTPVNQQTESSGSDSLPDNGTGTTSLIDLAQFRVSQDFATTQTKKLLTTVPVRRASKESFFRTHPDPNFQATVMLLELKQDSQETYLLTPEIAEALVGEPTVSAKLLIPAVTVQGVMTLWPIRIPGENGHVNEWNASAAKAAEIAKTRWIRLLTNQSLGAYEVIEARGLSAEPRWPNETFEQIVNIAFRNRVIDSLDHPVLRRLRGEA